MYDFHQQYQFRFLATVFVIILFKTMCNKTIIIFGFCDILTNQGLGKCYQPRPSARLITLTSTLIIPGITKTSSNNCLLYFLGITNDFLNPPVIEKCISEKER